MEFGAWDGKHFSNTYARVYTFDKLILVEGDPKKFKDLKETANEHKSIVPVLAFIEPTGDNCVDKIVENAGLSELDLLTPLSALPIQIYSSFKTTFWYLLDIKRFVSLT